MDGFYVVDETEQAVITQFGNPVGEAVTEPGLNFKYPLFKRRIILKRDIWWDGD